MYRLPRYRAQNYTDTKNKKKLPFISVSLSIALALLEKKNRMCMLSVLKVLKV